MAKSVCCLASDGLMTDNGKRLFEAIRGGVLIYRGIDHAAIGSIADGTQSYPFGKGDGSNTFTLPDMRGCVAVGLDNMGGSSANRFVNIVDGGTLGANGGTDQHQLMLGEMPAHNHLIDLYSTGGGGSPVIQGGNANSYWNTTSASVTGSGGFHTNTQPSVVLTYIIYAGV